MDHDMGINLETRGDESREQIDEETRVEIDESEEAIVERLTNDDYEFWRSTTPFLYNLVASHKTEWPSLTVEWLPDRVEPYGGDYLVQKIILGTHTANNVPNCLMLAQVKLPLFNDWTNDAEFGTSGKVEIVQQITHDGEVNRARYMPQNYFIIATKTISSEVHLFDFRNHPFKPPLDGKCSPDLRLRGHSNEGFGLSWSNFRLGLLLSGSRDANICLWDINGTPKDKALDALQIYKVNEYAVQDVAWHSRHESLFGSCGDDRNLHIWDIRSSCFTAPVQTLLAHESEMNCLAFNPFNDWIVATGSIDKTVKLFDLRKLTATLYTLESHKRGVNQIGWSPHHEEILASGCDGKRVMVWDLNRINQRQTPLEAEGGPPELLFIHGGHTESVADLSWNPFEDWTIASVANDNMMQIWKLAEHIYQFDVGTNDPPEHAKGG